MLTTLLIEYGKFILDKTRVSVTNGQIFFFRTQPCVLESVLGLRHVR
jgi:hypothetical protein